MPTPKATSMLRFGDYPVNLYSGLVDISVPIYTIQVNGINVPIEFKYHASGLKYDDLSMELGLGWTLMAGGIVTHAIHGFDDNSRPLDVDDIKDDIDIDPRGLTDVETDNMLLEKFANSDRTEWPPYCPLALEGQTDIYSYAFLGKYGKFTSRILMPDGSYDALFMPSKPWKFDFPAEETLSLTDENGICYRFKRGGHIDAKVWEYHIDQIISTDKADTVKYYYRSFTDPTNTLLQIIPNDMFITYFHTLIQPNPAQEFLPTEYSREIYDVKSRNFTPASIDSIRYRGGKVIFKYETPSNTFALSRILVYSDGDPAPMHNIKVEQSGPQGYANLDKVAFLDRNGKQMYDYRFEYDGTSPSVSRESNGSLVVPSFDNWGYFNVGSPATGSRLMVPDFLKLVRGPQGLFEYVNTGMSRTPDEIAKLGIIKKVIYPTKGFSTFEFELNRFNEDVLSGGLRIKEICRYDQDGQFIDRKWYKYGIDESGFGYTQCLPIPDDFTSTELQYNLASSDGMAEDPWYKTEATYYHVFPFNKYVHTQSAMVYTEVAEYHGGMTDDQADGKTVYKYSYSSDEFHHYYADTHKRSGAWKSGHLLEKKVYDRNDSCVYSLVNTYKEVNLREIKNLKVIPTVKINPAVGGSMSNGGYGENLSRYFSEGLYGDYHFPYSRFDYFNYYHNTGDYVLDHSVEILDGAIKRTVYGDYNQYGQPLHTVFLNSHGDSLHTRYKYPLEEASTPLYSQMVARNILAPVIEQSAYRDDQFLSLARTNYSNSWPGRNGNLFAPASQEFRTHLQNAPESRMVFHKYDAYGNPQFITLDDQNIVYLWGYRGTRPVAEIRNATYEQVAQALGQTSLASLDALILTDTAIRGMMSSLRESLPDALVTAYTYKAGMIHSVTDPSGRTTSYAYDDMMRLARIYDDRGQLLEEYEYHYQTEE